VTLRDNLVADRVSHLERSALVIIPTGTSLRDLLSALRQHRSGCALVCDGRQLGGIITERDLLKRVFAGGADLEEPVDRFLTPDPVTIHSDDPVGIVIRRMLKGDYRHLPIVDKAGEAVGVVSVRGLIHYLVEHFPRAVYNLPPEMDPSHEPRREGA
jgi:CBS domain-containing protein